MKFLYISIIIIVIIIIILITTLIEKPISTETPNPIETNIPSPIETETPTETETEIPTETETEIPSPIETQKPALALAPIQSVSINQYWAPLSTPSHNPNLFKTPYAIPDIEIYDDSDYASNIITKNNDGKTHIIPSVKTCCGRNISLIIDKNNVGTDLDFTELDGSITKPIFNLKSGNKNKYYYAMAILVDNLDKLIDQFKLTVGRIPVANPYRNRPVRIEIAYINAGGLASHGVYGMACGPAYLRYFYDSCIAYLDDNTQLPKVEHVFTYELCRNYIFPDQFTPLLDYRLYNLSSRNNTNKSLEFYEWGWVNQGFVNVLGGLLTKNFSPSVNFNYYGYDAEGFWKSMEKHLDIYINGLKSGIYTWDNTFMYNRLIWTKNINSPDGAESLDNLYSGILIRLWRNNGEGKFLLKFFKALKLMSNRSANNYLNLPNKLNYIDTLSTDSNNVKLNAQTAAENFYIASSYGASKDLYDYFTVTLKRSIRKEARDYANNLILKN